MRDGISLLEDGEAVDQFSIDVLNNDISEAGDDGVEAGFCMHNCRVVDNRVTNSFIAMSSQPGLGGPTYFVNNSIDNVAHVPFKLYRGSSGDVLLHNTVVKQGDALAMYAGRPVSDLFMRNNLFIAGPGATYNGFSNGSGQVLALADLDVSSADVDFDGFGSTTETFAGRFGAMRFDSLDALRTMTAHANAIRVDLDVFAEDVEAPADAMTLFTPPDLSVDITSPAFTAAVELANVGSLSLGATTASYGPR